MKRNCKWYRKNEKDIAETLGLKATKNSGSGWVDKEDFYNENVLGQLKSTDKESIKINRIDLEKLENNAIVSHKLPIFAIQFINKDLYLLVKPQDIDSINKYINTGIVEQKEIINVKESRQRKIDKIKSDEEKRKQFKEQQSKKYQKQEKTSKNFNLF